LRIERLKTFGLIAVAAAGFAAAVLVGVAAATSFTLNVATGAKVTNQQGATTHEAIAVGAKRRAIYTLSGDSKSHQKCKASNQCFKFWPPVTVAPGKHPTKAAGIKGKLSLWHRDGFSQVLLSGHPLYYFKLDSMGANATGEGIVSFGGTWHVVKADAPASGTTSTMTTSTTTTTPCIPYPGYPCP
jgi:predicted lipoprotein with Yx(FWY)xxD motif